MKPEVVAVVATPEVFTVAEAAALAGVSRQAMLKRLTSLGLLRDRRTESGPNKGRIEKVVLAEDLFRVFPKAETTYRQRQAATPVLAQMEQEEAEAEARRAKIQAENPGSTSKGEAKAWHLQRYRQFQAECGQGRQRALTLYTMAVEKGEVPLPDYVRAAKPLVSERSLQRWELELRNGGMAALDPHYKGQISTLERHPEQQAYVLGLLLQKPHLSAIRLAEALAAAFGKAAPGHDAVRRWLKKWKAENARDFLLATNPDKAKSKYQVAFGSRSEDVIRLNQRWETDATKADLLFKGDPFRYTLCAVVDVFSDRRRFLVAESSKGQAHGLLFRRCVMEWGLPEQVKTDNGKDYTSRYITRFFADMGIDQQLCKPFSGEEKPHVERGFGIFLHDLVELIDGYTGHNVAQAQDLRAQKSFAARLKEAKDGDAVEVGMTRAEFEAFTDKWCLADEHRPRESGRLKGRTPAEVVNEWAEAFPIRRVSNPIALDYLLVPGATKTIQKKGIQHQGRFFIAPELGDIVGRQVEIRLSPESAGRIAVFRDGVFVCHALDPELEGVSRAEVAAVARARQRASDTAKRVIHRELKKQVKPAAVLESILDARLRGVDPVSAFQVSEGVETQAMAAAAAASAAESLLPAQAIATPEDLPPQERARMLALMAKKAIEMPVDRFIRLINTPIRSMEDQEWVDHFSQTPEGRGVLRCLRDYPKPLAQGTTGL